MDLVDKLYKMIEEDSSITTYNNNSDLFKEFYFSKMSIKYNGPKVKRIMLYLLEVNPNEEDIPLLKASVFKEFYNYEQFITQSTYSLKEESSEKLEKIKDLIEFYKQLKKYDPEDKFLKKTVFIRDYTGALIILLNKSYFDFSNEEIKYCINQIKNNEYLAEIINGNTNNNLLDKEYIFDYFSRYLFTSEFVNIDNLEDDILLNKLFNGEIKNIDVVKRAYKNINIKYVFYHFNTLDDVFNSIDKITEDEYVRVDLKNIIINKLKKDDEYIVLFRYIMKHEDTILFSENDKDSIIKTVSKNFPNSLNYEDVENLMNYDIPITTYRNLKVKMQKEEWPNEIKQKINEKTKEIEIKELPFEESISLLKELFSGNKVPINKIMCALTSIVKTYLNSSDVRVYFFDSNDTNGIASEKTEEIYLNNSLLLNLDSYKGMGDDPFKLKIFETLFHECKHLEQFYDMKDENMTDNTFTQYKENLLDYYNTGFYSNNYFGINFEKEARVYGAGSFVYFLKSYFPEMEDVITFYTKRMLEEEKKELEDKKIFELSKRVSVETAFDKLVSINPSIVSKYSLLSKEYNIDGSKKENNIKL